MYQKYHRFVADFYDAAGKRKRKFFPTRKQARAFEQQQKARAKKSRLRAH